jgi:spermidine/putrescine transport system permease protein
VDAFNIDLAKELSRNGRKSGLTFAPEGGSERIRKVINKMVTEDDLVNTVAAAYGAGWRQVKLYFMCGLRFGRGAATALIAMPLVVPEIVVAITTLIFFSGLGMHHGLLNLMIAHTVFCIPFALLPIQARLRDMGGTLEEAGRDLYADEWRLFRLITLPLLLPAISAGAIMAFVVSLDDFLISMMVSSAGSTTLPVYIYGMMRLGVTPEVNAISTILLAVSIVFVAAALLVGRRNRFA